MASDNDKMRELHVDLLDGKINGCFDEDVTPQELVVMLNRVSHELLSIAKDIDKYSYIYYVNGMIWAGAEKKAKDLLKPKNVGFEVPKMDKIEENKNNQMSLELSVKE